MIELKRKFTKFSVKFSHCNYNQKNVQNPKLDVSLGGQHIYPRTMQDAINTRDNLAKNLYSRLFGWILKSLNDQLIPTKQVTSFSISLLDMIGFENLKTKNSLDQLLINTANEELQCAFNRHAIHHNQQDYQEENLSYHQVKHRDNRKTVDLLLQKPIGTFFYNP